MKSIFLRLWPFLFITAFVFIFHYEAITTKDAIYFTPDPWGGDPAKAGFPWYFMYGRSLHEECKLPLWSSKIFCGYPVFSLSNFGVLQPINSLLISVLPLSKAYNLTLILSIWVAGIGTYFLARVYGLSYVSSVLSGVVFSHSGYAIEHIRHNNVLQSMSLLPWLILCAEKYFKQRKIMWLLFSGIISGFQWFMGDPGQVYVSVVAVCCIVFYRYCQNVELHSWRGIIFTLSAISPIGLAIAAVQVLPLLELVKFSVRSGGISYEYASLWHYPWKYLVTFISPFYYGDTVNATSDFNKGVLFMENCAYVGIIPLLLAVTTFISGFKNKNIHPYCFILLFSLAMVLGTPIYKLAWHILPGLHYLRKPMIFLSLATLSLAILGGYGMQKISSVLCAKNIRHVFILLIIMVTSFDLYSFGHDRNLLYQPQKWYQPPDSLQVIKGDSNLFRVYSYPQGWAHLYTYLYWRYKGWSNLDLFLPIREFLPHGGEFFWNYNNATGYVGELSFQRHHQIEQMFGNITYNRTIGNIIPETTYRFITMMSIKYIVTPWDITSPLWELVYKKHVGPGLPDVRIYENKKVLPRAYVVGKIRTTTASFIFPNMVNENWDTHKEVWLEQEKMSEEFPTPNPASTGSHVTWMKSEDEHIELDVNMKAPGYLVLTDTWYPGWHATIDGKPTSIYKANYIFRALWLDKPGTHKVIFWYDPVSFKIGAVITLATLCALGVYFMVCGLKYVCIRKTR